MINTVLFDLDSTLLCMDQDEFVKVYFGRLCAYMARYGWEPQSLGKVIWGCVGAMIKNQEPIRNDIVFWQTFEALTGRKQEDVEDGFQEFYALSPTLTSFAVTSLVPISSVVPSLISRSASSIF